MLKFVSNVTKAVIIIVTAGFSSMAVAQTVADSASVYEFVEAYQHTYNTHDPLAFAKFYTEDADFLMFTLPEIHGRQAIENFWRRYWQSDFNKQELERRGTFILNSFRFLANDVAIANIESITGGKDSLGVELQTRKARGTWVLHRQSGDWLISAIRGMPTEEDSVVLTASLKTAESLRPRIRAFVRAYEGAFNAHDPAALTALYTDDADIVVRNSPVIHDRQGILNWWRTYFSEPRPYRFIPIVDEIRMMSPDVALINFTATGASQQPDAEQSPVRYARATWVVVRKEGKWLIAALRVLPSEDDRVIRRNGN